MVKCSTMLVAGVTFTGGLLLGLVLHLPGASSPQSRPIRSVSGSDAGIDLDGSKDFAGAALNVDLSKAIEYPSAIGVRSLLTIGALGEGEDFNDQNNVKGVKKAKQLKHDTLLALRRKRKMMYNLKHSRQVSQGIQSVNKVNISLQDKSSRSGYTSSKHSLQYSNENNKHDLESIGNENKKSTFSLHPKSINEVHNGIDNKNEHKIIDISSSYGNVGEEKVLNKYVEKQNNNVGENHKNSQAEENNNNIDSEIEIEFKKVLPGGKHTTSDISNKLTETSSVEMSVSIIDVPSNNKPPNHLKSQQTSSDAITNDRQTVLNGDLENHHIGDNDQNAKKTSLHGRFKHLWEIVTDGIYWSPQLEDLTPKGFSEIQSNKWRQHAESGKIMELKEGCGRMQNRLIVFSDGSKMCARYRINTDQIQGEVYSYYLAKVLGIENVLPPILTKVNANTKHWSNVADGINSAEWNPQKVFVLTPWLENLQPAYIPNEFHSAKHKLSPVSKHLVNKSLDNLTELVQWSDLIILDYLTGNVDRVVNNMFNLQWNSGMMTAPTHNLERVGQSGPLVFLDNESGLLHSYRLLDKYNQYHEQLLRSLCIFRKSTVDRIISLYQSGDITQQIKDMFKSREPLANQFPFIPQQNLSVLSQRLAQVYRQIIHCERHYAKNDT